MTKTYTTCVFHRFSKFGYPATRPMGAILHAAVGLFGILKFGNWDLFEIWILVLVIFMFYNRAVNYI
jgi:hypothetical protein